MRRSAVTVSRLVDPGPPRVHRAPLLAASVLLASATLATFSPVASHPFLLFDDDWYVTQNPVVRGGLSAAAAAWAFTTFHAGNWHPLTWLSHLLDVSLFGLAPGAHHLVNVFWHCAASIVLLVTLRSAAGRLWPAFLVAALFALHPLHVESVAWVAERKDVLSGFFWMLTLFLYVRYARRPRVSRYLAVAGSFTLGLLAKSMLVTLPAVLLLLDCWPLNRIGFRGVRGHALPGGIPFWRLFAEKLPLVVLAGGAGALAVAAQSGASSLISLDALPVRVRALNAIVSAATYLAKTVWPQPLAIYYPHPGTAPPTHLVLGSAILLLLSLAVAVLARRRLPALAFGFAWFVVTLLPVAGLFQVGVQAMADRYTYLPLVGIFVALVWAARALTPRNRLAGAGACLGAAIVLLGLAGASRAYLAHWRDSRTLFAHAAEVAPGNWLMHYNLGVIAGQAGERDEAIRHYREAARLKPGFPDARNNLGQLLAARGNLTEARHQYLAALQIKPTMDEARFNLALLLLRTGDRAKATEHQQILASRGSVYAGPLLKMISATP